MKLKICGLRDPENIRAVLDLQPDFVGFIFYEKSPRFVDEAFDLSGIDFGKTKKVGVFVDAHESFVFEKIERHGLEIAQLHGSESPDFCRSIRQKALVFKAFGMDENFDFPVLENYRAVVDCFLFDTKTTTHGGSGRPFDWSVLKKIPPNLSWILSGGLSLENLDSFFENQDLPRPFSLDVNSRFELAAGLKDIGKLKILINRLLIRVR